MAGQKKRRVIKTAHEIPKRRKRAIEEALAAHEPSNNPEWDRGASGAPALHAKTIAPGTFRTVHVPLLNVSMGDQWPIPVTVFHGSRPGPTINVLGAVTGTN